MAKRTIADLANEMVKAVRHPESEKATDDQLKEYFQRYLKQAQKDVLHEALERVGF